MVQPNKVMDFVWLTTKNYRSKLCKYIFYILNYVWYRSRAMKNVDRLLLCSGFIVSRNVHNSRNKHANIAAVKSSTHETKTPEYKVKLACTIATIDTEKKNENKKTTKNLI